VIEIEVRTQAELDAAIARQVQDSNILIVVCGDGRFVIVTGSPTMVSWGQSSPRMESWGQSSPTMVSWEQSSPRMVSWGQSSVTGKVGCYSQPTLWRYGSSKIDIPGATILEPPEVKTAEEWLDYYGIEVKKGVAVLYKAVDDEFISSRNFAYKPGTKPKCDDWDPSPDRLCGGGLHFCPAPSVALAYNSDATKFVACPVKVDSIVVYESAHVSDKVRAPEVAKTVWECTINGDPVSAENAK